MPIFLQGIQRILNCSKVQVAAAGLTTTWLAVRYAAADLPPTQRSALWVAFIGAVAVQLREIINAWTEEDVARVKGGDDVVTDQKTQTTADPPVPALLAVPRIKPLSPPTRSPTMPLRTKLPLVLIALTTILFLAGCQTCPELAVYREGLHSVDEPLYQAHLLLMDDAVKANIRSDADRQVVQQGIAAARGLYAEAGKTPPTP